MLDVVPSSFGQHVGSQIIGQAGGIQTPQTDSLGWIIFVVVAVVCALMIPALPGTNRAISYSLVIALFVAVTFLLVSTTNLIVFLFLWELAAMSAWGVGKLGSRGSNPVLGPLPVNAVGGISSLAMFVFVALLLVHGDGLEMGALKISAPSLLMALLLLATFLKVFGLLSTAWFSGEQTTFPISNALLAGASVAVVGIYPFLRFGGELARSSRDAQGMAIWASLAVALVFALATLRELDLFRVASLFVFGQFCLAVAGFSVLSRQAASASMFALITFSLAAVVLYLSIGLVSQYSSTRSLEDLGGLMRQKPALAFTLLLALVAAAGLPPFGTFVGRLATGVAMLAYPDSVVTVIWIVAWTALVLALFRVLAVALFPPVATPGEGRVHLFSVVPIVLGMAVLVFVSIWPNEVLSLVEPAVSRMVGWQ
ncbi:MAG: hypothetical protein M1358_25610 [Chloroflexi bacterium]|nr:hypothetical protein [Chloroflexota bacterium]